MLYSRNLGVVKNLSLLYCLRQPIRNNIGDFPFSLQSQATSPDCYRTCLLLLSSKYMLSTVAEFLCFHLPCLLASRHHGSRNRQYFFHNQLQYIYTKCRTHEMPYILTVLHVYVLLVDYSTELLTTVYVPEQMSLELVLIVSVVSFILRSGTICFSSRLGSYLHTD